MRKLGCSMELNPKDYSFLSVSASTNDTVMTRRIAQHQLNQRQRSADDLAASEDYIVNGKM